MYSDLLTTVVTNSDASLLRQELELLQAALFKVKEGNFDEVLKEQIRAWVAEELRAEFAKPEVKKEKALEEMLTQLKELPTVQLTLAFEPTQHNLGHIHEWLIRTLGTHVLVDVLYQPNMIGGAAVSYQGKYFDGSLAQKLEDYYTQKKTA
jgi:F0F1-type ATP synthase delta subunit